MSAEIGQFLKRSPLHKFGLLFPALTWLFIQLVMSGVFSGSSADAAQIEICTSFGIQQVAVDPETSDPVDPAPVGEGCDWCQSFGQIVDTAEPGAWGWQALARSYQYKLVLASPHNNTLRLAADYLSRAPPVL